MKRVCFECGGDLIKKDDRVKCRDCRKMVCHQTTQITIAIQTWREFVECWGSLVMAEDQR